MLDAADGVTLLLNHFNWHTVFVISSKSTRYSQLGTVIDTELNDPDLGFTVAKWSTVPDDADNATITSTLELVTQRSRSQ